ncbi:hypothetical protein B0H10DRAFT_292048 [Mycena sp. CBHHK59/15]|nr:hypothetical protein B0H10DRAFT_292048 [Mycena sp. CBHHK59/15]
MGRHKLVPPKFPSPPLSNPGAANRPDGHEARHPPPRLYATQRGRPRPSGAWYPSAAGGRSMLWATIRAKASPAPTMDTWNPGAMRALTYRSVGQLARVRAQRGVCRGQVDESGGGYGGRGGCGGECDPECGCGCECVGERLGSDDTRSTQRRRARSTPP